MTENESEVALIKQSIEGDQFAIQRLLMLHHDRISAIIERRIPSDLRGILAAEDACQDAYVAAVRELDSFEMQGEDAFYRWLVTITERKLVDTIRTLRAAKRGGDRKVIAASGRNDTSSIIAMLDLAAVHQHTPSRSAARRELVTAVQDALEGLREDYRRVIRLRYIQGLSVAEVAEQMGRSAGAVVMLCNRGLQRLGEAIGDASRFFSKGG